MAFVIKDRVFEYTTTTGTGTLTLAGTKSGYQQFAAVGNGNTTYYTIVAENGDWESGIGTYTSSGTTLARTTVLASSNSNNLVNFAAGTKEVFSSQPAGRAVAVDTLATSTSLGTSNLLAPSQNAVKSYVDNSKTFTNVRDFGAVGDGVTDDTAAFQTAATYFGSGGVLATANGGVLLVPKGLYKITGQTVFRQTGVRVIGEGQEATKIIVAANLGAAAVFKFDQTRTDYSMVGVGVENLRINMAGFTGHGVQMLKPYDGVSLRNLFVDNVAGGYNGYRIEPDPGVPADAISQTLLLENCTAIHKDATATEPLFYISNLQEAVLTGCKAFGTYESKGKAACYPFEFVDCRGVMLNGCSSAFASKHGVKITVSTRPSTGILIANHSFETIDGAVRADGVAGIGDVIDLSVINPRTEGGVANASGAFDLNRVIRSSIDAGSLTVNIDASSIANIVLSEDSAQVTNAGTATTILGAASQADTLYKIIAGGIRVSSAGIKHIETFNTAVQLYSSGAISVQADYPFGASQVGALLAVNRAGTVALSRVEIGAADSGGTGFRMLRVAN